MQRVGWLLMALFILAAVLGLTGKGGPLSTASVTTPSGTIDYPRITRWQSDEDVILRLAASEPGDARLLVSPGFAEVYGIDSIVPTPKSATATPAGHLFTFATAGPGEKEVVLHVTAGKPVLNQPIDVRIGQSAARLNVTILP